MKKWAVLILQMRHILTAQPPSVNDCIRLILRIEAHRAMEHDALREIFAKSNCHSIKLKVFCSLTLQNQRVSSNCTIYDTVKEIRIRKKLNEKCPIFIMALLLESSKLNSRMRRRTALAFCRCDIQASGLFDQKEGKRQPSFCCKRDY